MFHPGPLWAGNLSHWRRFTLEISHGHLKWRQFTFASVLFSSISPLLFRRSSLPCRILDTITVRAKIIAELILERVDPVILRSVTGITSSRTDSNNFSCKKSKAWKLLETMINSKQGLSDLSRNKRGGCGFFTYSWKLPAYSGAFLLTVDIFSFFTYNWSFFAYSCSFFSYNCSFFAHSGKVRLIGALKDCKQRSLTVSKKAPTVTKKASPAIKSAIFQKLISGNIFSVPKFQKKRDVHQISARNSGAGNGCADFMGAWLFWFLSAGKPPCP